MKISPLDTKPLANAVTPERKPGTRPAGVTAEPSAQVALSPAALQGSDAADGTFDAQKVQRLAQAIKDGKFEVNAEVIADKLIANAQELLGKVSK